MGNGVKPVNAPPDDGKVKVAVGYSKKQRRDDIVALLKADLATPAVYGSAMFKKYMPEYDAAKHTSDHYTTCGEFPQGVAKVWARDYYFKDNVKYNKWWGTLSTPSGGFKFIRQGLQALKDSARPPSCATSCWIGSGGARPKPGDFYLIVEPVKPPGRGGDLVERHTRGTNPCHVGVIISCGPARKATLADRKFFKYEALIGPDGKPVVAGKNEQYWGDLPDAKLAPLLEKTMVEDWVTADAGQGQGPSGQTAMFVQRLYQPNNGARISGEKSQEPGDRWLDGWLDIDLFLNWPGFASETP